MEDRIKFTKTVTKEVTIHNNKVDLNLEISFCHIWNIFIPVTRRVKGYTRFVGQY